jgi:hypothetical protein
MMLVLLADRSALPPPPPADPVEAGRGKRAPLVRRD